MRPIAEQRKKVQRGAPGFSIIELVVYMFIATIAIVVTTSFMVSVTKQAALGRVRKEVLDNSRLVMTRIVNDVRSSQSVTAVALFSPNELHLTNAAGELVEYRLNSTQSTVEYTDPIDTVTLTSGRVRVTNLTFSNQTAGNPDEVTINLTVEQFSPTTQISQKYKTQLTSTAIRRRSLY
jgi:hypothetical protein